MGHWKDVKQLLSGGLTMPLIHNEFKGILPIYQNFSD